jgi:hypothetical protein
VTSLRLFSHASSVDAALRGTGRGAERRLLVAILSADENQSFTKKGSGHTYETHNIGQNRWVKKRFFREMWEIDGPNDCGKDNVTPLFIVQVPQKQSLFLSILMEMQRWFARTGSGQHQKKVDANMAVVVQGLASNALLDQWKFSPVGSAAANEWLQKIWPALDGTANATQGQRELCGVGCVGLLPVSGGDGGE